MKSPLRLVAPVLGALFALGVFVVPAAANPSTFCTYPVAGSTTSVVHISADCGGGSIFGAGYNSMRIEFVAACDSTVNSDDYLDMDFNGDFAGGTNTNKYDSTRWILFGSTNTGGSKLFNSGHFVIGDIPCRTAGSMPHDSVSYEVWVPLATGTTFDKNYRVSYGLGLDQPYSGLSTGNWRPTTPAAITSVEFWPDSGAHFVAGSTFYVYIE